MCRFLFSWENAWQKKKNCNASVATSRLYKFSQLLLSCPPLWFLSGATSEPTASFYPRGRLIDYRIHLNSTTKWKHCPLEVGGIDELLFRVEIWAIQLSVQGQRLHFSPIEWIRVIQLPAATFLWPQKGGDTMDVLSSARREKGGGRPPAPRCQSLPKIYFDCSSNENFSEGLLGGGKTWEQIVPF